MPAFFDVFKPPPGDAVIKCKFFVKVPQPPPPPQHQETYVLTLTVLRQASQNVFRSTRNVESLSISFADDGVNHVIVFRLECKFGKSPVHTRRCAWFHPDNTDHEESGDVELSQALCERTGWCLRTARSTRQLWIVTHALTGTRLGGENCAPRLVNSHS